MELIPGLPDELARECLIRVPYGQLPVAASVCKGWKIEIESSEFRIRRKAAGLGEVVLVLAQAHPSPTGEFDSPNCAPSLAYGLSTFEPLSGQWSTLPPIPGFSAGLPMFCALAAVGWDLVVLGGMDPVMWEALNSVYIYNFQSSRWRRGADLPGGIRTSFCCASDGKRMVYVAGGSGGNSESLKSAVAYDLRTDKWISMPEMARARSECKGIFRSCGRFQVVSGYPTEPRGKFEKSAEAFDPTTWRWEPVQENLLDISTFPGTCVAGNGMTESLYMCVDRNVVAHIVSGWRAVAELPPTLLRPVHLARWHEKLMVIGSGDSRSHDYIAYTLDVNGYAWTRIEVPEMFSGHVMGGCCLEI